jgi:4-amino-4-deoxy-L-arabinose transferase and related glycosyltransferases of PMT family
MLADKHISLHKEQGVAQTGGFSFTFWLTLILIGIVACIPRLVILNDFMTIDEPYHWIGRVRRFTEALQNGDWAETNQTGHPGVTIMWLGSLGRALAESRGLYDGGRAGNSVDFLAMLRLPLAIFNSLAVVIGYVALRRLLNPSAALVASLFWAFSPFMIAHSALLHLDATLTSCMTLSALFALQTPSPLLSTDSPKRDPIFSWSLLLSALFGGLAFLTKAPSLLLLPLIGLIFVLVAPAPRLLERIWWAIKRYLLWLAIALCVFALAWPALWVAPVEAVMAIVNEIINNGGQIHHSGNYFWGRDVGDPGLLFYLAVIAWRSSPITLIGLLLLPWVLWRYRTALALPVRQLIWALLLFVVLFSLALTLEPKKFDRYLLPIWPSLEILAAIAWVTLLQQLAWPVLWRRLAFAGALFWMLGQLCWYQPYYLAYFNPLLGGGRVAQTVMLVGWGEGMEQVGAWLNARPDLNSGPVLSVIGPTLSPFVNAQVLDMKELFLERNPNYAVMYARSNQRHEAPYFEELFRDQTPIWTLQAYGIDYAQVYQLPRPYAISSGAVFGERLQLRGFSIEQQPHSLVVTPSWNVLQDQEGGRFAFVHLIDADGQRVAQIDMPIEPGLFPQWQAGQQFGLAMPLVLPEDLPAGEYRLALGVYDPNDWSRLDLTQGEALPEEIAGPDALFLDRVTIP